MTRINQALEEENRALTAELQRMRSVHRQEMERMRKEEEQNRQEDKNRMEKMMREMMEEFNGIQRTLQSEQQTLRRQLEDREQAATGMLREEERRIEADIAAERKAHVAEVRALTDRLNGATQALAQMNERIERDEKRMVQNIEGVKAGLYAAATSTSGKGGVPINELVQKKSQAFDKFFQK